MIHGCLTESGSSAGYRTGYRSHRKKRNISDFNKMASQFDSDPSLQNLIR
jgi:hypothetical protein